MSEVVQTFPSVKMGRPCKSKFDQYFDGQIWKVLLSDHPGVAKVSYLRHMICAQAIQHRVRVRVSQDSRNKCVYVQKIGVLA